jgi:hypothetical protein
MPKTKWLDRRIAAPGPYMTLCLSEDAFKKAMKHLGVSSPPDWIKNEHSHATVHHFESKHGLTCIVCLREYKDRDLVEVYSLLVHKSVHIWQEYAEYIGEKTPGAEQEAYAIQSISQELMTEFGRQTKPA